MCVPELKEKIISVRQKAELVGLKFIITCTARNILEQIALYTQGRFALFVINEIRAIASLDPITQHEGDRKVTWTLDSKHIIYTTDSLTDDLIKKILESVNYEERIKEAIDSAKGKTRSLAEAVDFAILKSNSSVTWDLKADVNADNVPDYEEIGKIGESVGLTWGGRFKNSKGEPQPDCPHLQVG